jgi:hypothetical protein
MSQWLRMAVPCWLLGTGLACLAQGSIYSCVDAKGRRITADRPIAECADREQRVHSANGTVRQTVSPVLSAVEQATKDAGDRKAAEGKLRQAEERRMERALAARYPNQAVHDAERARALAAVQDAIVASQKHLADLQEQRKKLTTETEFYKDPAKMPEKLKRQLDDNDHQQAAQMRVLANQEEEKRRVDARFDEELTRLRVLWAQGRGVPSAQR